MAGYIYSRWDGSEPLGLDSDKLMSELGHHLMADNDLPWALWKMQRQGVNDSGGRPLPSLQQLLDRLRQKRQERLDKYNLGSIMEEIQQKLEDVVKAERQGIQKRLDDAQNKGGRSDAGLDAQTQRNLLRLVEDMAKRNLDKLDKLPADVGGKMKELSQYDFMDDDACQQFQELMDKLKKQALQSHGRDLAQKLNQMGPETVNEMKRFVDAVNEMLEKKLNGQEPDFENFMRQFGQYFGPEPPQTLDQLIERLQNQMAQAQSLLESMAPEDRNALENLLQSMIDPQAQEGMARMGFNLERLYPARNLRKDYPFSGRDSISYEEALKIMEELQKMDRLESQFKDSQYQRSLEKVDKKLVEELIGDDSAKELEAIRNLTKMLEDAGYIRQKEGKYELTPRGMRKIGQKALKDVFAQLKKDRIGGHAVRVRGYGGEMTHETRRYEFGDDLLLNIEKTVMNALRREAQRPPVRLTVDDFEVFKTELLTSTATVLMLDLSLSMPMRGNFQAAKQVAVALDGLIRSQYPRDKLYIVGFSSYARRIKKEDLYMIRWDDLDPYTNMQHGLFIARKLLAKERCANKQILLISDGEPTAHIENENFFFQYPPSKRTLQLTLREVRNCTQGGIVINTFMLEEGSGLSAFVTQMAKMNKGRVFYTSSDSLGQYILVDYISNKSKRIK